MSVSILWNPFMPSVNIRSMVVWENDGQDKGGDDNDGDDGTEVKNYDNIYDAIDENGVGATVMVNGKEMAAVAADGYTGTNQSTVGSSGYTSADAIANAAMNSGNGNESVNLDAFGGAGEEITTFNFGGDDNLDAFGGAGEEITTFNFGGDDNNSVDEFTGSSGYISADATANNASNNSSDETAVGQMGAVNIESANASGGSGSLVTGGPSDEAVAGIATINSNQGGGDLGSEFGDDKYSADVIAYAEETGMTSGAVQSIANTDAYSMQNGKLVLNRDPTLMWDGTGLVENPDYANEVNQNETMTGNVGNGFGSNSDLTGGTSVVSAYDSAYKLLTDDQKMLVESGQATLSQDGTYTVNGGTNTVNGGANVELESGGSPYLDADGKLRDASGSLFSGDYDGQQYTGGMRSKYGTRKDLVGGVDTSTTGLSIGETGLDGVTAEDILKASTGIGTIYNEYDLNGDGKVTSADAVLLQQSLNAGGNTGGNTGDDTGGDTGGDTGATGPSFDMTDGEELLKNSDGSLFTGEYDGTQYVNGVEVSSTDDNVDVNENDGYMYYDGYLFKDGVAFSGDYEGATYVDGVVVTDSGENAQTAYDIAYAALTNEQKMLIESGQATLDSDGVFTDLRVGGGENIEGGGENIEGGGEATGPTMQDGFMVDANGSLFTGTANGVEYVDGVPVVTGGGEDIEGGDGVATGPTLDANGVMLNSDGTLFDGELNGKTYKDGLEVTEEEAATGPTVNSDGQLVNTDGSLFNGMFGGKNYINGVEQEDNSNDSVSTDPSMNADGLLANPNGTLFTGAFNGKEYVDGVEVTQEGDEANAGNQELTVQYPDGTIVNATVDADGNVFDADGNQIGTWDGTTFTRSDGTSIDGSLQSVTINMNDGSTLTGYIDGSNVLDTDGNIIGTINDQGQFVPADSSSDTLDEAGGGDSAGEVDTGYTVSAGIIYDADGNIIGYEDGYQSDTDTLANNLESVTGNSTAGLSRAEIVALIEEYMGSYNSSSYDPAAFMNAFGFALDPNFSGAVIPSFMQSDSGVYMRRMVKDRDTGEMRYIDVPIGGAFSTSTEDQRMQRRQGFGQSINF